MSLKVPAIVKRQSEEAITANTFQYTFRYPVRRQHRCFLGVRIFFINIPLCPADYASCLFVRHVDPVATGVAFMPGRLAGTKFLLRRAAIEYLPKSEKGIVKSFSFDCNNGTELCIGGEFMEFKRHAEGVQRVDGSRAVSLCPVRHKPR